MGTKEQTAQKTEQQGAVAYDEVPYESFSYPQTHPDHITTIAKLFGVVTPEVSTARVLEIGCAGGGNIFPQAYLYPDAHFVGIDYSSKQIEKANFVKTVLELKNVEFKVEDILAFDIEKNRGKFDYIICHGIFSWVPADVREKILEMCGTALSPEGLAVVSYNALPGWNAVRSLREMMIYHTNSFQDPAEKIKYAKEFLTFLAESIPSGNAAYRTVVEEEIKILRNVNDTYIFHDHLESNNTQFYLHDFVRQAAGRGLAYLGDSSIAAMYIGNLPPKAAERLAGITDIVMQEQYIDFILNRRFRFSILCKAGRTINRAIDNERIMSFYLSANMKADLKEGEEPDLTKTLAFKSVGGSVFNTNDAQTAALMLELSKQDGKPVSAQDLVWRVQKNLGLDNAKPIRKLLVQNGMMMALRGHITLRTTAPHYVTEISEKPVAYALARRLACIKNNRSVASVLGAAIKTNEMWNLVVQNLDGTKTPADIVDIVVKRVETGKMSIAKGNTPVTDPAAVRDAITVSVNEILVEAAKQALLVG